MKNVIRKRKYIVCLIVVFLYILSLEIINSKFHERKDQYYSDKYNELEFQLSSTLNNYADFSSYFYEKFVNNDYVLSSMQKAYHGDEVIRDNIRKELYEYFIVDYNLMKNYDIRQFHFHFPDTTSFLRMHAPNKYGDILKDARYSVYYVNKYKKYISGFEEGKIFNGFRYVYPLRYKDEDIGSAEVSVSMSTVISMLTKGNKNKDYTLILSKKVVESKVFKDYLKNYSVSSISDDFLFDNNFNNLKEERNLVDRSGLKGLFDSIERKKLEHLDQYKNLNIIVKYDNKSYEIIMIPIYNIEKIPVGYFISISPNIRYNLMYQQNLLDISIVSIIFLFIMALAYYISKNRELLIDLSLSDRLTKIDNRRKFDKDLNREILRSKRSNESLSVIMFDIDNFKNVNDTYGHHIGDVVLEKLARIIKENVRFEDFLARFGGEEFILILTSTSKIDAFNKAEKLRKLVEETNFQSVGNITISSGVYQFKSSDTYDDVIKNVDAAMYDAKKSGKNKVCIFKDEEEVSI